MCCNFANIADKNVQTLHSEDFGDIQEGGQHLF